MGRDPKFRGTFGLSPQPVAGVTFYQDKSTTDKPLEEVIVDAEKDEVLGARKEVLVSKLKKQAATIQNPKRFNVDLETGMISIDEEGGQYTQGEAIMISASIKGKSGQYDAAIALITAAKELVSSNQPAVAQRPKEFLVDPETGAITNDPENGEYTLSEARTISYSIQKGKQPESPQGQKSFLEKMEEMTQGLISQRLANMFGGNSQTQPKDPIAEFIERLDQVDKIKERFAPAAGGTSVQQLAQSGIRGEILKMLMEDERERLKMQYDHEAQGERNKHLGTIATVVKDNVGDGVRALMLAAEEIRKKGTDAAPKPQPEQTPGATAFQCQNCNNAFGIPAAEGWTVIGCPHCGTQYTREQVLGEK